MGYIIVYGLVFLLIWGFASTEILEGELPKKDGAGRFLDEKYAMEYYAKLSRNNQRLEEKRKNAWYNKL